MISTRSPPGAGGGDDEPSHPGPVHGRRYAPRPMRSHGPTLDQLLPSWHWRKRHTIIVERAPAEVFALAGRLTTADLPVGPWNRRGRSSRPVPVLDDLLRQGFRLFTEDPPNIYVLGRIGRFWNRYERLVAPDAARNDPAWFNRFDEPGFAKAALGLACTPVPGQAEAPATLVVAETRIVATDERTHQEFNRHWLVSSWANPHALEELLRAIRRRLSGP